MLEKKKIKNCDIADHTSKNISKETYVIMEATRNLSYFYDLIGIHVEQSRPSRFKFLM